MISKARFIEFASKIYELKIYSGTGTFRPSLKTKVHMASLLFGHDFGTVVAHSLQCLSGRNLTRATPESLEDGSWYHDCVSNCDGHEGDERKWPNWPSVVEGWLVEGPTTRGAFLEAREAEHEARVSALYGASGLTTIEDDGNEWIIDTGAVNSLSKAMIDCYGSFTCEARDAGEAATKLARLVHRNGRSSQRVSREKKLYKFAGRDRVWVFQFFTTDRGGITVWQARHYGKVVDGPEGRPEEHG